MVKKHKDDCRRVSVFQSEAKCEAIDMKMLFFIVMRIKLIFTRKVLHLATF